VSFFRNAASVLGTAAVSLPIGLVTTIVLARWLDVAERGLYGVTMTFAGLVVILSQLGWPSAAIHRLRRAGSEPSRVASAALTVVAVVSVLAIALCTILAPWIIERFLQGASPRVFYLGVALVPIQLLGAYFVGIARGIDRFSIYNAYRVGSRFGTLIALTIVLVIRGGDLIAALEAAVAVQAVVVLGVVLAVLRETRLELRVDWREIRESLRFGSKSYLQTLTGRIHERIDVFMIAYLLGDPTQVAFYAIAVGVIERLRLIPESIGAALFPQIAGSDPPSAAAFTSRVSRHCTLWVVIAALGLAIAAPLLIPLLYGQAYQPSVGPFLLLLPATALLSVYSTLSRYFMAIDRQQVNIITQLTSTTAKVGLNLWLIPRHGILGAAGASLASYGLEALLVTIAFRSQARQRLASIFIFQRDDLETYTRRLAPALRRLGWGKPETRKRPF
jgi:O-antigen/teichoic acid export membrane protein